MSWKKRTLHEHDKMDSSEMSAKADAETIRSIYFYVLRKSFHGEYRQGVIRGVPPSPNVSAQTSYVLGGWATPVWSGGCPCRLLPYVTHLLNITHYMVIDYRLAATFTHRHHIMQIERYIFFVAVAFTWKLRSSTARICRIKRSFVFYVLCQCARHHFNIQNAHLSFPRGNLILARGRSSVRPETRTHSELWYESGPVSFGVLPECTAAPARCFSTSPSRLALPGESCPLSDWSLLQHSHLLTDMPVSKAYPKIMNPMEIRPLIVGSLMGPSSSPSFRQGPGDIFLFPNCQPPSVHWNVMTQFSSNL